MNVKSNLLFTMMVLFVIASSCKKDVDTPMDGFVATGKAELFTSAIPDANVTGMGAWTAGDNIGIVMRTLKDSTVIVPNNKYNANGDGKFVAQGTDLIDYPTDGTLVNFVAYYPYAASVTRSVYKVDVASQTDVPNLMYSVNATNFNKSSHTIPHLRFDYQMAKVELNIKALAGVANISGMDVSVKSIPTKADFNLQTGSFGAATDISDIKPVLKLISDTSQLASLTLIPGDVTGKTVVITLTTGKVYTWSFPSGSNLIKGNKYSYDILLQPPVEQQVFLENFGIPTVTVQWPVATYTGWANPTFTFTDTTGTARIRPFGADNMGTNHIQLTNNNRTHFKIDNINTTGFSNLTLTFKMTVITATAVAPANTNQLKIKYNGQYYAVPNLLVTDRTLVNTVTINLGAATSSDRGTLEFSNDQGTTTFPGFRVDDIQLVGLK